MRNLDWFPEFDRSLTRGGGPVADAENGQYWRGYFGNPREKTWFVVFMPKDGGEVKYQCGLSRSAAYEWCTNNNAPNLPPADGRRDLCLLGGGRSSTNGV
jgi:hypothetical protein